MGNCPLSRVKSESKLDTKNIDAYLENKSKKIIGRL